MNEPTQNLQRQFDLCQRYHLLERILGAVFPAGPVRVLDVGAGADDLSRAFLPDRFAITLADTSTFGRSDITLLRPGAPLPFADRAFDVVLAMDVLEHVPLAGRAGLVGELARVAGLAVVLSHPNRTAAVMASERLLADAHRTRFGVESRFLGEHAEFGLPTGDEAPSALRSAALHVATFANCPLVDWLPLTVIDVALLAQFGIGGAKDAFNHAANVLAGDLRTSGEHYRTFVVGVREADLLPRLQATLSASQRERTSADDLAVAELIARTVVKLGEFPQLASLQEAIGAKDEHIRKLELLLQQQAETLRVALEAKDGHIRKLEAVTREQHERLVTDIATVARAKDEHIRKLEELLRQRAAPGR